mmetsp:Transcript_62824/g.148776  ORF Transcript_62824/g.148776 Transcript_62824/m.148776 type:complete len:702 (+) Transcript_62824:3-2108(+)
MGGNTFRFGNITFYNEAESSTHRPCHPVFPVVDDLSGKAEVAVVPLHPPAAAKDTFIGQELKTRRVAKHLFFTLENDAIPGTSAIKLSFQLTEAGFPIPGVDWENATSVAARRGRAATLTVLVADKVVVQELIRGGDLVTRLDTYIDAPEDTKGTRISLSSNDTISLCSVVISAEPKVLPTRLRRENVHVGLTPPPELPVVNKTKTTTAPPSPPPPKSKKVALGRGESDILVNVGGNRFTNRHGLGYVADSNKLVSFARGSTGGRIDDVAQDVLPLPTDETRDVGVLQTRRVGRKVSFSLQGSARKKAVTLLLRLSFAGFAGVDWNDRTAKAAARANEYALNIQVVGGENYTSTSFNGGDTVSDLVAHVAAPKKGKQFTIELTATKICDGEECGVAEVSLCSLILRPESSVSKSRLGIETYVPTFRVLVSEARAAPRAPDGDGSDHEEPRGEEDPGEERVPVEHDPSRFFVNVGGDEFTDVHKGNTFMSDADASVFEDAQFGGVMEQASHEVLPPASSPFFNAHILNTRRVGLELRLTLPTHFTDHTVLTLRFSEAGFQPPDELVDWQDTAEVAARRKKKDTVHVSVLGGSSFSEVVARGDRVTDVIFSPTTSDSSKESLVVVLKSRAPISLCAIAMNQASSRLHKRKTKTLPVLVGAASPEFEQQRGRRLWHWLRKQDVAVPVGVLIVVLSLILSIYKRR